MVLLWFNFIWSTSSTQGTAPALLACQIQSKTSRRTIITTETSDPTVWFLYDFWHLHQLRIWRAWWRYKKKKKNSLALLCYLNHFVPCKSIKQGHCCIRFCRACMRDGTNLYSNDSSCRSWLMWFFWTPQEVAQQCGLCLSENSDPRSSRKWPFSLWDRKRARERNREKWHSLHLYAGAPLLSSSERMSIIATAVTPTELWCIYSTTLIRCWLYVTMINTFILAFTFSLLFEESFASPSDVIFFVFFFRSPLGRAEGEGHLQRYQLCLPLRSRRAEDSGKCAAPVTSQHNGLVFKTHCAY